MPQEEEQRMSALGQANRIRSARARLRIQIRDGEADPVRFLLAPPDYLESLAVATYLLYVPRVGGARVRMMLGPISPSRKMGGLTQRERGFLAEGLEGRYNKAVA